MPTYSYYPQGRVLAGVAVEARHQDDDAALAHGEAVMQDHPDAYEVSIWCGERYVGRLPTPAPAAPTKPSERPRAAPVGAKTRRPKRARRGAPDA